VGATLLGPFELEFKGLGSLQIPLPLTVTSPGGYILAREEQGNSTRSTSKGSQINKITGDTPTPMAVVTVTFKKSRRALEIDLWVLAKKKK